jgi:hypothetical protein
MTARLLRPYPVSDSQPVIDTDELGIPFITHWLYANDRVENPPRKSGCRPNVAFCVSHSRVVPRWSSLYADFITYALLRSMLLAPAL